MSRDTQSSVQILTLCRFILEGERVKALFGDDTGTGGVGFVGLEQSPLVCTTPAGDFQPLVETETQLRR